MSLRDSLTGKRVLVTGGARGIGRATVERFLAEGGRVAVIDQDVEGCRRLRAEIPTLAHVVSADVGDRSAIEQAFSAVTTALGGLDVLINNAGISMPHRFLDIDPEDWRRVLSVNLTGVFHCAQLAARRMIADGGGVILNMGSVSGMVGISNYADYNASKAAVIELSRTMALELAPTVRVVAVCPGYVLTPMQESEYTSAQIDEINRKIPLGRHAKPSEIAALFAFLASDEAPFITGAAIVIDGGETAGGLAGK